MRGNAGTKKGLTLIEMVIAISITTIVMIGFTVLFANLWKSYGFTLETGMAIQIASRGIDNAVEHIRKARPSEMGGFAIEEAKPNEFTFYADYDGDGDADRLMYFMEDQQLKVNVISPDLSTLPVSYPGSGSTFTLADDVVNGVILGSSQCTKYRRTSTIDGTSGNPFTSLGMAHGAGGVGEYYFNIGGQSFRTQVESGGWMLVAGGRRNRDGSGYRQEDRVYYDSNRILTSPIISQLTEAQTVRITSDYGQYLPFDVMTNDSGVISRLLNYETLGYKTSHNATWVGDSDGRMQIVNDLASQQSLHNQLYYASGNSTGMRWIPSRVAPGTIDDRREQINFSTSGWPRYNDLNLYVRGAPVSAVFSIIATRQVDNSFLGDDSVSYTEGTLVSQGALCIEASDADAKPIFEYYGGFHEVIGALPIGDDFTYAQIPATALPSPVSVQDIRLVRIVLHVNPRPLKAPDHIQLQSFVTIRNLSTYDEES